MLKLMSIMKNATFGCWSVQIHGLRSRVKRVFVLYRVESKKNSSRDYFRCYISRGHVFPHVSHANGFSSSSRISRGRTRGGILISISKSDNAAATQSAVSFDAIHGNEVCAIISIYRSI